jgi:hypothetical protein
MTRIDLTIIDVLKDPLIRLMMRADGVSVKTMKALLIDAARKQKTNLGKRKQHVTKNRPAKDYPEIVMHGALISYA